MDLAVRLLDRVRGSRFARALAEPGPDGVHDRMSLAAFLVVAAVLALTFRDYGITWDELYRKAHGEHILSWYASFFNDTTAFGYRDLRLAPGLYDLAAALAVRALPLGLYEARHLFNAFIGFLCLVGAWKTARYLGGPRTAFWTLAVLVLSPAFYGHLADNPKDIPFAAAYVWTLYYLLQVIERFPRIPRGLSLKLGASVGAALGVRIGGSVLVLYLIAAAATWIAARVAIARNVRGAADDAGRLALSLLPAGAVAYVVMLAGWPWAQHEPIAGPIEALGGVGDFYWPGLVLFKGLYLPAAGLPWDYLPTYLLIKLPELTLAALAAGLALVCVRLAQRRLTDRVVVTRYGLVAVAASFPIVLAACRRPVMYDEMRHFLFTVPPISCLAGAAIAAGLAAARDHRVLRASATAVVAAACVFQLGLMVRLHPYQYVYYNALAGGLKGADGRYEIDYWGQSYREAALRLTRYVHEGRSGLPAALDYRVAVCGPGHAATYSLPGNFSLVSDPALADFSFSLNRRQCIEPAGGREVARVERMGVTLSVVKDLRLR